MRTAFATQWDLDPARCDAVSNLIETAAIADRGIAHFEALKAIALKALHGIAREIKAEQGAPDGWALSERAIAADVAAATAASDRTMQARMHDATALIEEFPATFTALMEGRISKSHVNAIVDEGAHLEDAELRARYELLALERGAGQSPGRLRALVKTITESLAPRPLAERHVEAFAERRTWTQALSDGQGLFCVQTGLAEATAMQDRVTAMAVTIHRAAHDTPLADGEVRDERTLDQLRADVAADLFLTGIPTAHVADEQGGNALAAIRGTVQVTIPAATLTGASNELGVIAGAGPVDPNTARHLAGNATIWSRLFADPHTGCLKTVDAYVPTAQQKRFLRARDEHCRFPGCRQPVRRCDLDHTTPYSAGGPTNVSNLGALCRRHHLLKHHGNWTVVHGTGGVMTWTSPTGRTTHDHPAPVVRFMPTEPPPPPRGFDDPPPF